jgi:hypothetical protein
MSKNYHSNCYERSDCRLCGSHNLEIVLSLPPTPPANEFLEQPRNQESYPLQVMLCMDCGHSQLSHVVNSRILFDDYLYVSGTSQIFIDHFNEYFKVIEKSHLLKPNDLIVEIGSNDGTLLRNFSNFRVLGVEPAKKISEIALESGIPTLNSYFSPSLANDIVENHGKAKLILANNVMAHIDNLSDVVRGIKLLLDFDGIFVMEVQYLGDMLDKGLFDMIYFEHLDYHAVTPLIEFFKKHKLKLFDVTKIPTHGGSIRCFVSHINDESKNETDAFKFLVQKEAKTELLLPKPWRNLELLISTAKKNLTHVLAELKKKNKKIIAYGAPAKLTTLFYTFGLDKKQIDYVVDDSPLKIGLYTPGTHIPILSSSEIYVLQHKPDAILITAWNFSESIIAKHSKLKDVVWITPFPNLIIG